jgi:hypothetical protein
MGVDSCGCETLSQRAADLSLVVGHVCLGHEHGCEHAHQAHDHTTCPEPLLVLHQSGSKKRPQLEPNDPPLQLHSVAIREYITSFLRMQSKPGSLPSL